MTRVSLRARKSFAVLLAFPTLALAASCGGGADTTGGETGGTIVVVLPADPKTLFPPVEATAEAMMVITQVYDKLANIGDDMNSRGDRGFTPALATSWAWATDSMSIAFTLDSLAHWHDGQPLVPEDVRYTFRTYNSPYSTSPAQALISNIDSVSIRDAHTVVFWFKRRTPQQFMDATYHMFILPSHLLAQIPDSALSTSQYARQPVGTGRFRFQRWDAKERIEIVADTTNSRGRAKLDRVIFSFTNDAGTAVIQLFSGEADLYEQMRPEHMEQFAKTPSLKLVDNPTLQYQFLGFNFTNPKDSMQPHPIFSDAAVRRALVLATDRDRLTRSIFDTLGRTSVGPAPRALLTDTTNFTRPSFSTEKATALLDSAGWRDTDNDGIRDRNGVKLSFEVIAPNSSMPRQRAATQLMEQYRRIGVELKPLTLQGSAMGERLKARDFDAWMGGWQPTPGLLGVPGTWSTGGNQNIQHYSNAQFDAAIKEALSTFDEARSTAAFGRAMQVMWDDPPAVWLYEPQFPIGMHKRIRNAPIRADGWYGNLADWTIDPAQRIKRDRIGLKGDSR
jgi:peptide/nickel transport system substrate-binding protein